MILVDTSIWIDHFHTVEPRLVDLLAGDEVGCHDLVIEELALGSLRRRAEVLDLLANLYRFPTVQHHEVLHLVDRNTLWGNGLSVIDVRLLASVALVGGARLWTGDKRLMAACRDVGAAVFDGS